MRNALILIVLLGGAAHAAEDAPAADSRWAFRAGFGVDLAQGREVNPQYTELRSSPLVFAGARFDHYGLNLEYAVDPSRQTTSGALRIRTQTTTLGAWGRYAFGTAPAWQPFVTAGGGVHLDQVRTTFQSTYDERGGVRRYLGVGGGVSKEVFRYVVSEVEARLTSEEASRRFGLSLVFRVGVTF